MYILTVSIYVNGCPQRPFEKNNRSMSVVNFNPAGSVLYLPRTLSCEIKKNLRNFLPDIPTRPEII